MDKPEFRVERGPETEPEPFAIGMAKLLEREGRTVAAAELRRLHAENEAIHQAITDPENQPSQFGTVTLTMYEALKAQRDALLETLRHAAAIAHSGGLQGMTEWQSLVAVRRLTQPYFERSGSITETHDRLRAAIAKAEEA